MTETKIREEICRLGRSLFERGLTPGSSGNISVKLDDGGWLVTPTNASLGSLDPARLSRLGAGRQARLRRCPDQGSAAAHRAVPDPRRRARGGASAFDPFGGAVDAAGDRPARRAAADDALLPDEMRLTALVPYYRPGDPAVADAIKGLAGKYSSVLLANHGPVVAGDTLEAAVYRDRGTGRDRKTLSAAARASTRAI